MHMNGSVFEQNEFVYADFIYVDIYMWMCLHSRTSL